MKTRIIAAMFAMALLLVSAPRRRGYNTPEVDDMTMHRFNAPRSLAEVVGQDRYQLATLTEKVDGIIRRGVVTRVRPTGEGFEYTFPEGVDAVYLVDVEIYNPGARPVTLEGIESAIPVRPGHGVRVLIPGGDVTRGPIVMGRLTPAMSDSVTFSRAGRGATTIGEYPAIGWPRSWVADISAHLWVEMNQPNPPNTPVRHYPETISWFADILIVIESADGGSATYRVPFEATLYMTIVRSTLSYEGRAELQHLIEVDDAGDLGAQDLTLEMPTDSRVVAISMENTGTLRQATYRGNEQLVDISNSATAVSFAALSITLSELGPGTK